jgi:hypothetical protein
MILEESGLKNGAVLSTTGIQIRAKNTYSLVRFENISLFFYFFEVFFLFFRRKKDLKI